MKNCFCKMFVGMILAFALASCGPDGYVITGKAGAQIPEGSKVILKTEDPAISDSTIVKNGSFTFRGQVEGVLNASVKIGDTDKKLWFILVNDKIRIDGDKKGPKAGAVHYEKSKAAGHIDKYFEENTALFYEPYKKLLSLEIQAEDNPEEENAVRQRQDSLIYSYIDLLVGEYEKSDNREGLSIIVRDLTGLFGTREHPEKIKELYALVPENEKNSIAGRAIRKYFDQSARIVPGQLVDFEFTDAGGSAGKVSDYKGKLVLIEFWATWCGPCLAQFPMLEEISSHADKIKIITVSIDEDTDKWKAKARELNPSWVNIHSRQGEIDLKKHFFVTGVPDNLLLSPEGKILRKRVNLADVAAMLEENIEKQKK